MKVNFQGMGSLQSAVRIGFKDTYKLGKCLLTTSCTDALEMAAILTDIQPGDEVIVPSYTFVSTANAFVLRGAKLIFIDSRSDHPGVDESLLESLITEKNKSNSTSPLRRCRLRYGNNNGGCV